MRNLILVVTLFGCDSGSSNPLKSCSTLSNSQSSQSCNDCVDSKCSSQISSCFDSGGACVDYANCLCACQKNDLSCFQGCQSKQTSACTSCLNNIGSCAQANCSAACNNMPDMAMPAGAGCTNLAACCAQLDANQQPGCNNLVGTHNDANCTAVLNSYKNAGMCH
jgi:hypothetical protein